MEPEKSLKDMSIKDDLYLSPFEKYTLYGIFPWSFLLSLILVILSTSEIIFYISINTNYSYQQLLLWNKVFLNRDADGSDTMMIPEFNIYHYPKLKTYIQQSVDRYFDINSNTLDNYKYHYQDDGKKKPIKLYINYMDTSEASRKGYDTEYILIPRDIGPFSKDTDKDFINLIDSFTLEFNLIHDVNSHFPTSSTCFTWKIKQNYKYTLRGTVVVTLNTERGNCGNGSDFLSEDFFLLHFFVFIASLCSIYNFLHKTYQRISVVSNVNSRATFSISWENLSASEKMKFFSIWSIIDLSANIFQMLGAISCIFSERISMNIQEITVGFGCFFAWIGLVQYLKPNKNAYTVGNTMKRSYKILGPYIIGILPIFLAFAFYAIAILWKTGNYPSLAWAMLLQFSIINGDSLVQSITSAVSVNNVFGLIYTFSFLLFFICVIHNIFIAIISESYESLKVKPIGGEYQDDTSKGHGLGHYSIAPVVMHSAEKEKKCKLYSDKPKSQNFKKLLNAKLKNESQSNEKTIKVVKKANKLMKKIRKNIEKIGKHLRFKNGVNVDREKIVQRAEELLLTRLDEYIEKLLKRNP